MENLLFGISIGGLVSLIPALPLVGAILNGFIALLCRSRKRPVPKLRDNQAILGMAANILPNILYVKLSNY